MQMALEDALNDECIGRKDKGEDGKKKEKLLFCQKRCIRICEKEGID